MISRLCFTPIQISESDSYSERRLSWTAVGYPLANGSSHVIFDQSLQFSQSFSNLSTTNVFGKQHDPPTLSSTLETCSTLLFQIYAFPTILPLQFLLPTILMSVLQYPSLTGRVFLWWGLGVEIKISQLYTKLAIM